LSGFSSRLWMKISSPSRNTSARKPSHLGSKIQLPSAGNSSTRFASIGRIGGFTERSTPHGITWLHLLIAAEKGTLSHESRLPSPFRRQPKSVRTPKRKTSTAPLSLMATRHFLTGRPEVYIFRSSGGFRRRWEEVGFADIDMISSKPVSRGSFWEEVVGIFLPRSEF
jgi:hypothetical protein